MFFATEQAVMELGEPLEAERATIQRSVTPLSRRFSS